MKVADGHTREVAAGERFEFGKNWERFLRLLNPARIAQAEQSLLTAFETRTLEGRTFLDVGSGSGLFSLAARNLGARVHSFDYDPYSVACTMELKRRYYADDSNWVVECGSALDPDYLRALGEFDIVYSWGVLHHTGRMWQALDNVAPLVRRGGKLMIAIYNDQGAASRRWTWIKKNFNRTPKPLRLPILCLLLVQQYWRRALKDILRLRPFRFVREYGGVRGMSIWRDLEDWVGGYPFEVARPEEVFDFYRRRGFNLVQLATCNDLGCNEFVFERI